MTCFDDLILKIEFILAILIFMSSFCSCSSELSMKKFYNLRDWLRFKPCSASAACYMYIYHTCELSLNIMLETPSNFLLKHTIQAPLSKNKEDPIKMKSLESPQHLFNYKSMGKKKSQLKGK